MDPTVHHRGDFIPMGRRKAVHGGGVVAQCELRMADYYANGGSAFASQPYTGVLTPGRINKNIIMRFSSVLDPVDVGLVPSFALKVRGYRHGTRDSRVGNACSSIMLALMLLML